MQKAPIIAKTKANMPPTGLKLVVPSQDTFSVSHDEIGKTKAMLTVVGGRIVFEK
jgi:hypothetical protein